jgi:hypothetical protein
MHIAYSVHHLLFGDFIGVEVFLRYALVHMPDHEWGRERKI